MPRSSLVIYKALAWRDQDRYDIEQLLTLHGDHIDLERSVLSSMSSLKSWTRRSGFPSSTDSCAKSLARTNSPLRVTFGDPLAGSSISSRETGPLPGPARACRDPRGEESLLRDVLLVRS